MPSQPGNQSKSGPWLIAVMGQTASGKSDLADSLAESLDAIKVNADAFMVYRGMDIGTNKPKNKESYELLDLCNPDEDFGLGRWISLAAAHCRDAYSQGSNVVLVGGTGLYIRALMDQWDDLRPFPQAELRQKVARIEAENGLEGLHAELSRLGGSESPIDMQNPVRVRRAIEKILQGEPPLKIDLPAFKTLKIAIDVTSDEIAKRIANRTAVLLKQGWVEEVQALRKEGYGVHQAGFRAIGYPDVSKFLDGELDFYACQESINQQTRNYAKRQRTWLRKEAGLILIPQEELKRQVTRVLGLM